MGTVVVDLRQGEQMTLLRFGVGSHPSPAKDIPYYTEDLL